MSFLKCILYLLYIFVIVLYFHLAQSAVFPDGRAGPRVRAPSPDPPAHPRPTWQPRFCFTILVKTHLTSSHQGAVGIHVEEMK